MHYCHNWRTFLLFISLIFSSISNPPLQCLQIKLGVFLKCSPSFFCCLFCSAFSANVTTNFLAGTWFTACGRSEAGMFPRLRGLFCRHSSCYGVSKLMSTCWTDFPETARHHKVAPFEFGYHSFWQNDRASAFVSFLAAWTWLPSSLLSGLH